MIITPGPLKNKQNFTCELIVSFFYKLGVNVLDGLLVKSTIEIERWAPNYVTCREIFDCQLSVNSKLYALPFLRNFVVVFER